MNDVNVAKLRELLGRATKGPWKAVPSIEWDFFSIYPDNGKPQFPIATEPLLDGKHYLKNIQDDFALIVAMKNDLPALLDEVERLERENMKLRDATQADAMVRHMINGMQKAPMADVTVEQAYRAGYLKALTDALRDSDRGHDRDWRDYASAHGLAALSSASGDMVLRAALEEILRLRPAGDIETAKNIRSLVKQIEIIAAAALAASPTPQSDDTITLKPGEWATLHVDRAIYVDRGKEIILADRLPGPITLVVKMPGEEPEHSSPDTSPISQLLREKLDMDAAKYVHAHAEGYAEGVEAAAAKVAEKTQIDGESRNTSHFNAGYRHAYREILAAIRALIPNESQIPIENVKSGEIGAEMSIYSHPRHSTLVVDHETGSGDIQAPASEVERERIARIIDPRAWSLIDYYRCYIARPDLLERIPGTAAPSLAKADAILSAIAPPADLREALDKLGYTKVFNAISGAIAVPYQGGISISVEKLIIGLTDGAAADREVAGDV